MTAKELWAMLKGLVTIPDDKKAEVDALVAQADKAPTTPPPPTPGAQGSDIEAMVARAVEAAVSPLKAQNDALQVALKEEADARKKSTDALLEAQKRDATAKIDAVIKGAIETGRIPAQNEDMKKLYTGLLEKDFDSAKQVIDALTPAKGTPPPTPPPTPQGPAAAPEDKGAALRTAAAAAFANN